MINNSNNDNIKISFSILMANYNHANYIEEAIHSVISQTYPYWKLIIVDDASTDNSIEKIKPYLKDNRIKFIIHKKNLGYGGALKTAADNALNMVLAIFDSDDKLHESALEVMAKAYKNNPEYGFIYSTYWVCDFNLKNPQIAKWIGPIEPNGTNLHKIKVSHFKTFRRDVYRKTKGFDPNQKSAVDKDIIFKLEEVSKLKFIDKPLYYYRSHELGISQGKNQFITGVYYYIAKLKAFKRRLNTNIPNLTKKELYFDYFRITFYRLNHFFIYFYKLFRITTLIEALLNKFSFLPLKIKKKLIIIQKLID